MKTFIISIISLLVAAFFLLQDKIYIRYKDFNEQTLSEMSAVISGLISDSLNNANSIRFDINADPIMEEGRFGWNSDDGTLELGMPGGNVNLQIGLEQFVQGKNTSGTGTTNGKAVRISGVFGSKPEFGFSDADNPAAAGAIGLFTEDIINNGQGYITTFGYVRDINTSGSLVGETWNNADRIFVSNISSELTNVPPTSNERKIFIGINLRAHATEGIILVSPINVSYLYELSGIQVENDTLRFWTGSAWKKIQLFD